MRKLFAAILMLALGLASACPALSQTALDPQIEKIRVKVNKIGLGHELTVVMKNRDEYHGAIKSIGADSFIINEVDLKQPLECKFTDVLKVQDGYGHTRDVYGRRISPHKHLIGLIILAAGAAVLTIVVLNVAKD